MIYVISHKCPDTDSVIASVVYQKFLEKKWAEAKAIMLEKTNNETNFIFDRLWISLPEIQTTLPEWSSIALVDHNEDSQTIDNISNYEITSVIDHHKIWGFKTNHVPYIRVEPIGSTNSVLAKMFEEKWFEVDQITAKLIVSAIVSDTMYFRAPTTTNEDKSICEKLNKIAWFEDLEAYSMEMFKAKSDLWDISPEEVIKTDYKQYEFWDKKIGLWVLETTNPWYALWRKQELIDAMNNMKSQWLDFVSLSIVDILNQTNITIVPSDFETGIYAKILDWKTENNLCDLWKKVSRKLDIVPVITKYFS